MEVWGEINQAYDEDDFHTRTTTSPQEETLPLSSKPSGKGVESIVLARFQIALMSRFKICGRLHAARLLSADRSLKFVEIVQHNAPDPFLLILLNIVEIKNT